MNNFWVGNGKEIIYEWVKVLNFRVRTRFLIIYVWIMSFGQGVKYRNWC